MLDRPRDWTIRVTAVDTCPHGSPGPIPAVGSPRRGAALPADERRLLLPLRAHRTLGLTLPPMPGYLWFHVVTSGRLLARDRGRGRGDGSAARRPRARAARGGPRPAQRAGRSLRRGFSTSSARWSAIATRSFATARAAAPTGLICGAVRFEHPAAGNLIELLPPTIHIEASELAQARVDAEHAAADGRRGRRARGPAARP